MNRLRVANVVLYVLSGSIITASLTAGYLFIAPVDVLRDWRIVLPQQAIHAGDEITVQSIYTKVRNVTGHATRYIECDNKAGVSVRYQLNEAIANRGAGHQGTGIVLKIPDDIPDLPALCRISTAVDYPVYSFRSHYEYTASDPFPLQPGRVSGSD